MKELSYADSMIILIILIIAGLLLIVIVEQMNEKVDERTIVNVCENVSITEYLNLVVSCSSEYIVQTELKHGAIHHNILRNESMACEDRRYSSTRTLGYLPWNLSKLINATQPIKITKMEEDDIHIKISDELFYVDGEMLNFNRSLMLLLRNYTGLLTLNFFVGFEYTNKINTCKQVRT